MRPLRNPLALIRALFRKQKVTDDLDEELRFHLERETEANLAKGLTPEDARRQAAIDFGSVERAGEAAWEQRSFRLFETTLRHVRYSLRGLRRNPGFVLTIIVTLSLGVGANTAIFSVVHALLLSGLPYQDADRLLYVSESWPHEPMMTAVPSPDFMAWRNRATTAESIQAFTGGGTATLTDAGGPRRVDTKKITGGFLTLLGIQPALGRNFTAQEDSPGGPPVAILSYKFWQQHFGSSAALLGRSVELDGVPTTVVGILPASFIFPDNNAAADVLKPMQLDLSLGWHERTLRIVRVIMRPKIGVSPAAVRKEYSEIVESGRKEEPPQIFTMRNHMQIAVIPLRQRLCGDVRPWVLILQGVVVMILLVACLNVANLQINFAVSRQKEMAVRTSLGATASQIAAQLLTESLVLALFGGFVGMGVAASALPYLLAFFPANLQLLQTVHLDLTMIAFTLGTALFVGILTGMAPLATAYKANPIEVLKVDGGKTTGPSSHHRLRATLVIAEASLAVMLLMGSGLLIRSFLRLRELDLGFDAHDLLTLQLPLSEKKYPTPSGRIAFFSQLVESARAMPGVRMAAVASGLPLVGTVSAVGAVVDKRPAPPPGGAPTVPLTQVSGDYFRALGIPLLRGRVVTEQDGETSTPVVIVNQAFATKFFPGEAVIGRHIKFGSMSTGPWREVIGIVGDVREGYIRLPAPPMLYVPYRQQPDDDMFLVLKSALPGSVTVPQALQLIRRIDASQPVDDVATMESRSADFLSADRANTTLMGIFAAIALALAVIGIFAAVAYFAGRRTKEIGIRMALGARKKDVLWMVFKPGMTMTATGMFFGLVGSAAYTRTLRAVLFDVRPIDPLTIAAASAFFLLVTSGACYLPARRAAKVDPMVALRYE